MTLQEVKDQYAKELGYDDWYDYRNDYPVTSSDNIDEVARRYAKTKLEEAAEKAKVKFTPPSLGSVLEKRVAENPYEVDKESITNINLD